MLVNAPAAGREPEVVDDRSGSEIEGSIADAVRDVHTGLAEAHDVGASLTLHVREEPRVPFDAPAAGIEAEVPNDRDRIEAECAVALAERDEYAVVAKAYDIAAADAADVGHETRMFVDAPTAGIKAKVVDDGNGREVERAVALAERDEHAVIAEPDDVNAADAADIGEEPRVLVDPPATGVEPEIANDRHRREVERAVAL